VLKIIEEENHHYVLHFSGGTGLVYWNRALRVQHVLGLLHELQLESRASNAKLVLIVFIPESVPPPLPDLRDGVAATLPALMSCCRRLLVAVPGEQADRYLIRSLFHVAEASSKPELFRALEDAVACAQVTMPSEVLELKRRVLYPTRPPREHGA
jgi:hypothetical protein